MTTYVDGGPADDPMPQCLTCADGECITAGHICEDWVCRCGCKLGPPVDPVRARELDNRPPGALENIARDLEAEARPHVQELVVERFGKPTRSAA